MVAVDACCCDEGFGSGSTLLGSGSGATAPQLVACNTCSGTGFNAPYFWDITISGMTDDACTDCATYNSTFRVEYNPGFSVNRCAWTLAIPEGCAICRPVFPDPNPHGADLVSLQLFGFQGATPPTVEVRICRLSLVASGDDLLCDPQHWKITFREVLLNRPDCLTMDNYLINDPSPDQARCPNASPPPFGLVDACDANPGGVAAECRITAVTQP